MKTRYPPPFVHNSSPFVHTVLCPLPHNSSSFVHTVLWQVIELPIKHPELFEALGVAQPKGVLLYGPPGTGKTLLARAVAHHTDCTFIRVSGAELVQKYIGEGSRMVRELFVMAREAAPSIIFMDEVDSIGSARQDGGGDSEVQRTMLELLNQLDGESAERTWRLERRAKRDRPKATVPKRPSQSDRPKATVPKRLSQSHPPKATGMLSPPCSPTSALPLLQSLSPAHPPFPLPGFEPAQNIKVIMATNRIDILDSALLRPGRIDRKIELPHPNVESRAHIMTIHSRKVRKRVGRRERVFDCASYERKHAEQSSLPLAPPSRSSKTREY